MLGLFLLGYLDFGLVFVIV